MELLFFFCIILNNINSFDREIKINAKQGDTICLGPMGSYWANYDNSQSVYVMGIGQKDTFAAFFYPPFPCSLLYFVLYLYLSPQIDSSFIRIGAFYTSDSVDPFNCIWWNSQGDTFSYYSSTVKNPPPFDVNKKITPFQEVKIDQNNTIVLINAIFNKIQDTLKPFWLVWASKPGWPDSLNPNFLITPNFFISNNSHCFYKSGGTQTDSSWHANFHGFWGDAYIFGPVHVFEKSNDPYYFKLSSIMYALENNLYLVAPEDGKLEIKVFSLTGRKYLNMNILARKNSKLFLPLGNLKKGIYYLYITHAQKTLIYRILKIK